MKVIQKVKKFIAVLLLAVLITNILPVSELSRSSSVDSETGSISVNADSNDRRRTWIQLSKGKKTTELDEINNIDVPSLRVLSLFLSNYYIPFSTVIAGTSLEYKGADGGYDEEAMTQYQKDMSNALQKEIGFDPDAADYIVSLTVQYAYGSCQELFIPVKTLKALAVDIFADKCWNSHTAMFYSTNDEGFLSSLFDETDAFNFPTSADGVDEWIEIAKKAKLLDVVNVSSTDLGYTDENGEETVEPMVSLTYAMMLTIMNCSPNQTYLGGTSSIAADTAKNKSYLLDNATNFYWIDNGKPKVAFSTSDTDMTSYLLATSDIGYKNGFGSGFFSVTDTYAKEANLSAIQIASLSAPYMRIYVDWVGDLVCNIGTGAVVILPACYNSRTFKTYNDMVDVEKQYLRPLNLVNAKGIYDIQNGNIEKSGTIKFSKTDYNYEDLKIVDKDGNPVDKSKTYTYKEICKMYEEQVQAKPNYKNSSAQTEAMKAWEQQRDAFLAKMTVKKVKNDFASWNLLHTVWNPQYIPNVNLNSIEDNTVHDLVWGSPGFYENKAIYSGWKKDDKTDISGKKLKELNKQDILSILTVDMASGNQYWLNHTNVEDTVKDGNGDKVHLAVPDNLDEVEKGYYRLHCLGQNANIDYKSYPDTVLLMVDIATPAWNYTNTSAEYFYTAIFFLHFKDDKLDKCKLLLYTKESDNTQITTPTEWSSLSKGTKYRYRMSYGQKIQPYEANDDLGNTLQYAVRNNGKVEYDKNNSTLANIDKNGLLSGVRLHFADANDYFFEAKEKLKTNSGGIDQRSGGFLGFGDHSDIRSFDFEYINESYTFTNPTGAVASDYQIYADSYNQASDDKISVSGYGYLHIPYGLKITWTFDDKSTFVFDNTQNTKQCLYAEAGEDLYTWTDADFVKKTPISTSEEIELNGVKVAVCTDIADTGAWRVYWNSGNDVQFDDNKFPLSMFGNDSFWGVGVTSERANVMDALKTVGLDVDKGSNIAEFADLHTWFKEHASYNVEANKGLLKNYTWLDSYSIPVTTQLVYYDSLDEITKETTLGGENGLFKTVDLFDLIEAQENSVTTATAWETSLAGNAQLTSSSAIGQSVLELNSGSNSKLASCLFYTYVWGYFNQEAYENNIPFDKDDNVVDMRIDFSMYPQEVGDIDWSFVKDTTGDEIMSFVYYFLHPSKGAGYVRTWFKTKISGILLGWHEDIVGSTYSNSTTGMTKYLGFTGYVTIPTLNDISWVSKLLANYNSIIVYLIILMCVIMLCYVIIGSLTLQRGILGVIIFAVFAFLPPLAINTVVDFTNQVNDRIYTAKFDYWALVQMQQYVMELDEARKAKAEGDMSTYANFVISQYTSASTADSVGGERLAFYSGVKLKWMSPKKYATIATLSDKMDSVSDNGAHYLKNILLNSVANKVSGETYIDSSSALYLYRDYFDIYRYASCAYNDDKMAGTGYTPIINNGKNTITNNWKDNSINVMKYSDNITTIQSLILLNIDSSETSSNSDTYPTASTFAIRRGFLWNTGNIPMDTTHNFTSDSNSAITYYNDNSTRAVGNLLKYTQAYKAVSDKYARLRKVIDGDVNIDFNKPSGADVFGIEAEKMSKGIQEFTGGVKGEELSLFETPEDYAYFYYALYTESPFYFFSFNVQDQLRAAKSYYNIGNYTYDYNNLTGDINGSVKDLFLSGNQEYFYNMTNMAGDGYGELRDYMNFHDFFYYVMPVLRQGTQLAKDFDDMYGLYTYDDCPLHFQDDGKFIYGGFGDQKYSTFEEFIGTDTFKKLNKEAKQHFWHDYNTNTIFNAYSAWYDTMLDCDYAKPETKTIAGKKFTIEDPLDPTSYYKLNKSGKLVEGRYMVFSRSEMKFYGLTDSDLTQVEKKLIKVADEVYKESIDLMNYYTLSDEVLIQAYAMNQLFAFNKEFSQTSLLSEDYVMYPQAYELKAFTYDAYLRLILSGSTGEDLMSNSTSEYLTDETAINSNESMYERIMKNTSIFFGLVLLINDFLAVYVLPALKLFFLVLIFLSSVALIIASSIKMEQPVNAFWKCLLAPMLGFAAISIGMAWLVSKFMSEGAQGVVQTSELIVLGDPTMVIVVMTVINVVALILYWKLLKKALGTFINYAKAIGASIGGVVAGVAGGIVGGLTGGGYHFNKRNISKVNSDGDRGSDSSGGGHHNTDPAARGAENDPKNGKAGLGTAAMAGAGTGMVMAQMDGEGSGSGANPARMNGSEGSSSEEKTNAYNEKSSTLKSDAERKKEADAFKREKASEFEGKNNKQIDGTLKAKQAAGAKARQEAQQIKGNRSLSEMSPEEREAWKKARLQVKDANVSMQVGNQIKNQNRKDAGIRQGANNTIHNENQRRQNAGLSKIDSNDTATRKSIERQQRKQNAQKSGFASKPQQTQPKLQQTNNSNKAKTVKYNNTSKKQRPKNVHNPSRSSGQKNFKVPPVTKK